MNFALRLNKNQRSKMTYKRFCRSVGYHDTPQKQLARMRPKQVATPTSARRLQPPNGSQALRCKPRALAQGHRLAAALPHLGTAGLPSKPEYASVSFCREATNANIIRPLGVIFP